MFGSIGKRIVGGKLIEDQWKLLVLGLNKFLLLNVVCKN